jgi:hypothetical protein
MRGARRLVAAVVALALCAGAPAAGAVVPTGIADQAPDFLGDPLFTQLGVRLTRVVVPWDAALTGDARTERFMRVAADHGVVPLVAFDRARDEDCSDRPACDRPAPEAYAAGVRAFLARWPAVREIVPFNEPNHRSEPTAGRPELAAAYYAKARRACPGCLLVAGDLLDAPGLRAWLEAYRAALPEEPAVWGLHDYYDATYFSASGIDTLLDAVPGQVWLTETGGIVRFGALPEDEARAAGSIRWMYGLAAARPRVTRLYLYQWESTVFSPFDAGLVRPDGTPRPSLDEVRRALGIDAPQPAYVPLDVPARPVAHRAAPSGVRLRGAWADVSGKGLVLGRRGLRLTVSCLAAPRRCDVRAALVLAEGRFAHARLAPAAGTTQARTIRLTAATRRAVARRGRVRLTLCLRAGGRRACRVSLPRVVHGMR